MEGPDFVSGGESVGEDSSSEPGNANDGHKDQCWRSDLELLGLLVETELGAQSYVVPMDLVEHDDERRNDDDDDECATDELRGEEDDGGGAAEYRSGPVDEGPPGPEATVVGEAVADQAGLCEGEANEDTYGEERDEGLDWVLPPEPTMSNPARAARTTTP